MILVKSVRKNYFFSINFISLRLFHNHFCQMSTLYLIYNIPFVSVDSETFDVFVVLAQQVGFVHFVK